jgi:hypothetical protein
LCFLLKTTFKINSVNFTKCSSTDGFGGALFSSSENSERRLIDGCVFSGNSALQSVGLDIFDSSNRARIFYRFSTVINCISESSAEGAYILFGGTQVYCFINLFINLFVTFPSLFHLW